jgi:hypothetical protein
MQYQGESALWSMIVAEIQAAWSYAHLGGATVQSVLWVFVISLVLPWIFLFFDYGLPRNQQQDHEDGHGQQHEQDEELVE